MMMMETMSNKFGPKLRYCPVCHQVWELELPSNKKIVHKDFPVMSALIVRKHTLIRIARLEMN